MFSFLTGRKDPKPVAEQERPDPPAQKSSEAAADPSANPPVIPAGSSWDTPDETPFIPPAAWNIDALTAPVPKPEGETPQIGPVDPQKTAEFQQPIIDVIKTVYDPEIPVDIYELGLIYDIQVDADQKALIKMTLTSPACPSAQQIPQEVRYKVKAVPGITDAWVDIVWEPPWSKDRMSEVAKLTLGII